MFDTVDYAETELDIQSAMVDLVKRYPDKTRRPSAIRWGSHLVQTFDIWGIPKAGYLTLYLEHYETPPRQGFDLKLNGAIQLKDGTGVSHLRTWADSELEDSVGYNYVSEDGVLRLWNVYERKWPNGDRTEEKWSGNAGFIVEKVGECERVYRCSHGLACPPDFSSMVVRVSIH